jgi:glycosyltransferase involved in cell wall biosynthesis
MSDDETLESPVLRTLPTHAKRILYVVHRYGYPGGSEQYTKDMAEETRARGHVVAVFAGEHQGNFNGVRVSSETKILQEPWDLIVVHGGDVAVQDFVLQHAAKLGGPVLYLLILPSHSLNCVRALRNVRYIGCSTLADWRHVESYGVRDRSVRVRHGIVPSTSKGTSGFREKFNITTPYMFLSSGGYWPNKAFAELVDAFESLGRTDATLVLTGYDNRHGLMPKESTYVKPFLFPNREDSLAALHAADLYILNSYTEGFGLVLLESMLNLTPWCAREIAGGEVMREYGFTYTSPGELKLHLQSFRGVSNSHLEDAYKYVMSTHLIRHTVDDILKVLG